jgi:hypothetical protein
MREFTKSMTSYTWAMSLFGLQQVVNAFRPSKAAQSFDQVTKATEEQFGDALKASFRVGDNLQKGFVDVTFGVLTLGMFNGGGAQTTTDVARQTGEALRQGGRVVNQAVDLLSRTVQTGTSAVAGAAQQATGTQGPPPAPSTGASEEQQTWGPMPTPAPAR